MESFLVKTEEYIGPLDKILELVEEKKISLERLELSKITDDFLAYISTLKQTNPLILADFLVIASKLALIKSQILVNQSLSNEEEEEIKDLEKILSLLSQLKPGKEIIKNLWQEKEILFSRPYLFSQSSVFYPPTNVSPSILRDTMEKVILRIKNFFLETKEIRIKTIKLEEKIYDLIERIRKIKFVRFNKLIDSASRSEIVVYFLALLHLLHEEKIIVEQENHFSEIILKEK